MQIRKLAVTAALAGMAAATPAIAGPCGSVPCSTRVALKGTSILPPPDEFKLRGDVFSERFTDVGLAANGSREVILGFTMNLGFGAVNSLFINENGLVSFQRPISAAVGPPIAARAASPGIGFQPVTALNQFGVPVIAPFYADLVQGSGSGNDNLDIGDVVVQYGLADPYADDNGEYNPDEARKAVRITWYGLEVAGIRDAGTSPPQAFAQLLLSSDQMGESSFEFRYGPLSKPGQEGYGSIAGFSLGPNFQQFSGPYRNGSPTFFEFQDGKYVGQAVNGAVPEPTTWMMLLVGFGALGFALRRRGGAKAAADPGFAPTAG